MKRLCTRGGPKTTRIRQTRSLVGALASIFVFAADAQSACHLWKINEVFSNLTGTIQFIELKECCGGDAENFVDGKQIISIATGKSGTRFGDLAGLTGGKYLLFATAGFAALPGAPTPDAILADGLIDVDGDTLRYHPISNYDNFAFGLGDLPTDGYRSIHVTNYGTDTFVLGTNSPTNYAGQSGSINAGSIPAVSNGGLIALMVILLAAGGAILAQRKASRGEPLTARSS